MSSRKSKTVKFRCNENTTEEPEFDPEEIRRMYGDCMYSSLAKPLGLPLLASEKRASLITSEETVTSYIPKDSIELEEEEVLPEGSYYSSHSHLDSYYSYESVTDYVLPEQEEQVISSTSLEYPQLSHIKQSRTFESDTITEFSDDLSQYVNHTLQSSKQMGSDVEEKRKAFLKLLRLPLEEAASWRPKLVKTIDNLNEMSLEERGDFLINMITSNFCKWLKGLGGDEEIVIDETILKELFQVGMDNPASRSIAVQIREKNVLYHKVAELFGLPEESFHNVLIKQLNWDLEAERRPAYTQAFGSSLPPDLQFRPPKNNTQKTWFESDRLPKGEDNFEDVYREIAELSSTKEYCKWLLHHPQYRKPKYLKKIGMFTASALYDDESDDSRTMEQILSEASMLTGEFGYTDSRQSVPSPVADHS